MGKRQRESKGGTDDEPSSVAEEVAVPASKRLKTKVASVPTTKAATTIYVDSGDESDEDVKPKQKTPASHAPAIKRKVSVASEKDSAYASQDDDGDADDMDVSPTTKTSAASSNRDDEEEYTLLGHVALDARSAEDHEVRTAPLFTRDAYVAAGRSARFPQRGVLGSVLSIGARPGTEGVKPNDARLYINTNAPFSALVCGVQGSGKSHTVSVLLENMLISRHNPVGKLEKPLSALVLHFGEGGSLAKPSEAAWVTVANAAASLEIPSINVFVSKSALKTMTAVYAQLGNKVKVKPLLFNKSELDVQAFLSMMAIDQSSRTPLYMSSVMSILHELGEDYSYQKFKSKLDKHKRVLNLAQVTGLTQRMSLLESFLLDSESEATELESRFAAGQLTVVDLSDPFLDPSQACGLFEIVTRLFIRADVDSGKVLVLDEAHKYLESGSGLTRQLTTLIRMQRHLAMRVIVSTQEPNVVPPVILDLCSVSILHRFSSPSWWEHVSKHVSAEMSSAEAFDRIVKLQTGQAIVLAPAGLGTFADETKPNKAKVLGQFGRNWLLVKTRQRVTQDGGASVLVVGQ